MASNKISIATGLTEDCENLIARFQEVEDVRFQSFCEIWKDMKFSLIFTCRQTLLELTKFCEEALHIAKQFLLVPTGFKERIGGLYLVYGMYYKMPVSQFKIRLKLEDWCKLMELHSEIKEGEHLDANYILSKLIADNAFHYCIFDYEFGLEKHYELKTKQYHNPFTILPAVKDLCEKGQVLHELSELSEAYKQQKSVLSSAKKPLDLNLYDTSFGENLVADIRAFKKKSQPTGKKEQNHKRTVAKKSSATSSKASSTKPNYIPFKRQAKRIRAKLGHAFDTDSSDSDDLTEVKPCN